MEADKRAASAWFAALQQELCSFVLAHEKQATPAAAFEKREWQRSGAETQGGSGHLRGGGVAMKLRGQLFEKAGVNVSTVHGVFSETFRQEIPGAAGDGRFWASGISVVIHPRSPLIPAIHMNTRLIITSRQWFGGGIDLNPAYPDSEDTERFFMILKRCCDSYDPEAFEIYRQNCDVYFRIRHRQKNRGVGGIFIDNLNSGDFAADFAFIQRLGRSFIDAYEPMVVKGAPLTWTPEQEEHLLRYRGLYAEFNLLYDRGTRFGLMTGGDSDAILMSLPPRAIWP